jgi:predicted Zn-dependent protease
MGTRLSCMFVFILGCLWAAIPVKSQEACPAPSYTLPAKAANIFSEQQENDLGDAVAETLQRRFRVIDDEVTNNLRRIGQRLLSQLPLSRLRIQFYLVDYPEANAVSLPGGCVYVTRKMVAFCRSEDEIAGVIAHELGHVITRQSIIRTDLKKFSELLLSAIAKIFSKNSINLLTTSHGIPELLEISILRVMRSRLLPTVCPCILSSARDMRRKHLSSYGTA